MMENEVYRERARLVAHLAAGYPAGLVYGADPDEPDWPLIYIFLPTGQVSWHISPSDLDLFHHVVAFQAGDEEAPSWDGSEPGTKYARLAEHAQLLASANAPEQKAS